jgi:magnesium transporter
VIVDCAVYREGQRLPGEFTPESAFKASRCDDAFVWIGLHEPTEEEFEVVRVEFGLHELAVEDAVKAHQRPKLEKYADSLFLVLKTARYVDKDEVIQTGEILLFLGEGFIVAVRHGEASGLKEVRKSLELRPEFLANGPSAVLYGIVDRVVDDYLPVVAGLEDDIEEVEAAVFSSIRDNPVERIYYLKREVLEFRRATAPLLMPLNQLAVQPDRRRPAGGTRVLPRRLRPSPPGQTSRWKPSGTLSPVSSRPTYPDEHPAERGYEAHLRLGGDRRRSHHDRRNLRHELRPHAELRSPSGYPLVLASMLVICTSMYVFFRKRDWL